MVSSEAIEHMMGETTTVESGRPLFTLGEARLGPLIVPCDGTIAGQVWGAGAALAHHLLVTTLPERPVVVDVGSGTGVAGLAAAVAGACKVALTDLPDGVDRLSAAIAANEAAVAGAEVLAAPLPWGDVPMAEELAHQGGFDLVLAADVLYTTEPEVLEALRTTLKALAKPSDALILHAYEERWPAVVALWRDAIADERANGLRLVRERELEAPIAIQGRRLILEELRLTEDALYT